MAYTVEVRRIGSDPAESAAETRPWLDRNDVAVIESEHSTGGPGATFRVFFPEAEVARAFAIAFHAE